MSTCAAWQGGQAVAAEEKHPDAEEVQVWATSHGEQGRKAHSCVEAQKRHTPLHPC